MKKVKRFFTKKKIAGLSVLLVLGSMTTVMAWSNGDSIFSFSGNVGIGTEAPSGKLEVVGNTKIHGHEGSDILTLRNMENGGMWNFKLQGDGITSNNLHLNYMGSLHALTIRTINGNVGIGTEAPSEKLEVVDNTKIHGHEGSDILTLRNMENGGMWTFKLQGDGITSNNLHLNYMGSLHALTIRTINGNVGIGTTAPSTKLEVVGTVTATNYACSSDERFKKNISPITNAMNKLMSLKGVSYNWRTEKFKDRDFGKRKELGLIAQDVETIFPELVYTDAKGYKSLSYNKLTAVLVEAVKELNTKSVALEKENMHLKKEIASLKKLNDRIVALEKMLNGGIAVR